ncbi:MAG: helix-turn-helix domain-containing protein [Gammaproteobacteria bacterium]
MKIATSLTDSAVLAELGQRLTHRRIALGLTQAEAATEAGISKRTLERLEAGEPVQTPTLVRVLRQLDALPALDALLPPAKPGPVDALQRAGEVRKRAPRARKSAAKDWRWGDE